LKLQSVQAVFCLELPVFFLYPRMPCVAAAPLALHRSLWEHSIRLAAMPDGPSGVIRKFDGKETKIHKATFSGGDGQSRFTLVELLADVEMCELEGTASLWLTKISADFVLRSGAQQEQIISDLQRILNDELNLNVSLKFEDLEREVLVASGSFVGKPAGPFTQFGAKPRST